MTYTLPDIFVGVLIVAAIGLGLDRLRRWYVRRPYPP